MPCLRILLLVPLFLWSGIISGSLASSPSAASGCNCSDSTTHDFSSFASDSAVELLLLKDAGISNGVLHLTADDGSARNRNSSGAALLAAPVTLWCQQDPDDDDDVGVNQDASFEASFTMGITIPYHPSPDDEEDTVRRKGGDDGGLAFVMVPSLNSPALGILGLSNNPVASSSTSSGGFVVTFTFDTVVQSYDDDLAGGNRTIINLNVGVSVSDAVVARLPLMSMTTVTTSQATIMNNCTVWIEYSNGRVSIYVDDVQGQPKPDKAAIDVAFNLSDHLPQRAFVGLLASTDMSSELLYSVLSWNLQVSLPAGDDGPSMDWKVILPAVLGGIAFTGIMNLFVAVFYFNSKYNKLKMELVLSDTLRRLPGMPREFKHATMRKATDNFHEARKLGKGGFGAVYKGTLRSAGKDGIGMACVDVAVKKFTRDENRCYDDFLAEVDIINRLRHRNIVPLVGWCYEKGDLLLIYEYMPNGSLDHHLFPNKEAPGGRILGWTTRYGIIVDVAAGLHYVHHEHEHMVLHRDIKASNIMLDSTFHGRLGDFGLARIVGFDRNSITDLGVAGTWGFIAPEYSVSRKSTRKTDIYAFGVLTLEIVTGRRALSAFQDTFQLLTDWVWRLHREGRLLEAVDKNVISTEEEYEADDATRLLLLGLACTNPNPLDRPSMAEVVQVVAKSVPAPNVPLEKPTFVWPPEEGIPCSCSSFVDDITEMSDLHDSQLEETSSSDALAASAIIRRKARAESVELYCL